MQPQKTTKHTFDKIRPDKRAKSRIDPYKKRNIERDNGYGQIRGIRVNLIHTKIEIQRMGMDTAR